MAKNVFISNNLPQVSVGLIPRCYSLDYNDSDAPLSKAELISRLKGKDGLICHIISTIDDEVLAAAPTLKVVANVAVGYNNIDVAAAKRRGVIVTNTPDVLTETTADFAWALLMAAARRVVEADRYARSGQWKAWKWDLLWGADVHGKTLGIVGFGRIGRAIARRAQGFNMRILYHDAVRADAAVERELSATATDLETLLREADFVTLHTNLTPVSCRRASEDGAPGATAGARRRRSLLAARPRGRRARAPARRSRAPWGGPAGDARETSRAPPRAPDRTRRDVRRPPRARTPGPTGRRASPSAPGASAPGGRWGPRGRRRARPGNTRVPARDPPVPRDGRAPRGPRPPGGRASRGRGRTSRGAAGRRPSR